MVRGLVRGKRDARDDDHDDEVPGAPWLEITHRTEDREGGDGNELGPERERLQVPWELGHAMASPDDIHLVQRRPIREREGTEQRLTFSETRRVVRDKDAREGHGMRERVREGGEAMSFGRVKQEVEVGADLQPEAEEQRIDQGVDHFYRAAEHILGGQLERAAH